MADQTYQWMVIFCCDADPPTLYQYDIYRDARDQYDRLNLQWTQIWLVKVLRHGDRDQHSQPEDLPSPLLNSL
mgnify:CR=1 FL=1